ncbi:hypothetical protein HW130_28345 [Streptomyces sp. PKU-EA00015]|uniref:hypothetical protein n=1 Tax=Streptomyces sp. PKU-EA00015 TaxID=2748326 RepID=UPI0015A35BB3|nr:hypothetical protein [Streptomyces sp. PKU-EA00015]NWF30123.1 hypothetical protein [Streptomyces sp. PKU-EA00015]
MQSKDEFAVRLTEPEQQAVRDLADARGAEDLLAEAVRHYLHAEGELVRAVAARYAADHADLLRRLGE